jgi:hypothetical protein
MQGIVQLSASDLLGSAPGLATVLVDAVSDGASVGFLDPFDAAAAAAWWEGLAGTAPRSRSCWYTAAPDGRCIECGGPGPCPVRENAVVIFSRTLRLPVRRPGATRPELASARRVV